MARTACPRGGGAAVVPVDDERREQRTGSNREQADVQLGVSTGAGATPRAYQSGGVDSVRAHVRQHLGERRLGDDPRGGDLVLPERLRVDDPAAEPRYATSAPKASRAG